MKFRLLLVSGIALLTTVSMGLAQTVTVDGVGPDDGASPFATVAAAADFFLVSGDGTTNVINITADTVETRSIILSDEDNWTINGGGNTIVADTASPPQFAAPGPDFTIDTAILIRGHAFTYDINDFILTVAHIATNEFTGINGITFEEGASGVAPGSTLNLTDVIVAGSKAGTVPAMDPNVDEYFDCTQFATNFSFFSLPQTGPRTSINLLRCESYAAGTDAFGCFSDDADFDFNEGIIGAWSGDESIAFSGCNGSTVSIDGTASERNLFRGNSHFDNDEEGMFTGTIGTIDVGDPATDNQFLSMTFTDIVDNGGEGTDFNESIPQVMNNCFFVNNSLNESAINTAANVRIGITATQASSQSEYNLAWSDITIYSAGNLDGIAFGWTGTDLLNVAIDNAIIAANPGSGIYGRDGAESTVNLTNSAVVTVGPDANGTKYTPGTTLTINEVSNVIENDPAFIESGAYIYPPSPQYLKPGNSVYGTITGAAAGTVPVELSVFTTE